MKRQHKLMYNNYQYYENDALAAFLEKQAEKGYYVSDIIGRLANMLVFKHEAICTPKSYQIYCKNQDDEIDSQIETMRTGKWETACENIQYIILSTSAPDTQKHNPTIAKKKQDTLLGISPGKSLTLIAILLLISVLAFCLKLNLTKIPIDNIFWAKTYVCAGLIVVFLLYLTGDLHDYKKGLAIHNNSTVNFTARTKFKDTIFTIGDICRLILLAASILTSILLLCTSKAQATPIEILKMWLLYAIFGYLIKLKYRRSYISLLILSTFLIILGL